MLLRGGRVNADCNKLIIHHIGGRFGAGAFPVIKAFAPDSVNVFYDADVDCIEQIKEMHASSKSELRVLPYCIGRGNAVQRFNINYDPTSSSLYRYNPEYGRFYFFCYSHDFIVSENMRSMEERMVTVTSMDELMVKEGAGVAPPDFLSLDAQGAEFDILQGAHDTLKNSVLGLVIETWFHPVYAGQQLFGDISRYLSDRGFHFVRFLKTTEYSPARFPVGLRADGFQVFSDTLFLRSIDSLKADIRDASLLRLKLRKLAFMAIVFGQMEYALMCLDESRRTPAVPSAVSGARYEIFLRELEAAEKKMPLRYPPSFSEKYSYEISKGRFLLGEQDVTAQGTRRSIVERLWLRFIYPRIYSIAKIYDLVLNEIWAGVFLLVWTNTPVEKVLSRYGLTEQYRQVKKRRAVQRLFGYLRKERNVADAP